LARAAWLVKYFAPNQPIDYVNQRKFCVTTIKFFGFLLFIWFKLRQRQQHYEKISPDPRPCCDAGVSGMQ
jgi:hypothetical protein